MFIEVHTLSLIPGSFKGANETVVFFFLNQGFIFCPQTLESVDNDSIDNIDQNQHDSEVEDPVEEELRPVARLIIGLYRETESRASSDSINNKGKEAME